MEPIPLDFTDTIRLHRMHSVHTMRPIATCVARSVVFVFVHVSICWSHACTAKTAKSIEMPFGGLILCTQGTMY